MNIFVAGMPGCGKSKLVEQLIFELKKRGKNIAGIITPEVRRDSRQGFEIIDIATGSKEILASVDIKGPKVSKYHINIAGIEKIVEIFEKSLPAAEIIFIDEIGKMEMYSEKFKTMLARLLVSNKIVVATLHRTFVKKYKSNGKLFWLERGKLEEVKAALLEEIQKYE